MSWYALEKIEEALNQTKDFLLPFNFKLWSRLAVLVLLLGGGLNNVPTGDYPSTDTGANVGSEAGLALPGSDMTASMHNGMMPNTGDLMTGAFTADAATTALVGVAVVIALVLVVLSTIARFAFFQSVMEKQVSLRKTFKSNFTNGLQLIGFNLLMVVVAALPLIPFLVGLSFESAAGILLLVLSLFYWLAMIVGLTFVNDFGLPLMVSEGINILDAAKRALAAVSREKGQAAIYFLTKIGIGVVLGIISLVALITVFLGLLIPFGILGVIAFVLSPVAGGIIFGIGLFTLMLAMLYVRVPLETYRHYFYVLNLEEFEDVELVER